MLLRHVLYPNRTHQPQVKGCTIVYVYAYWQLILKSNVNGIVDLWWNVMVHPALPEYSWISYTRQDMSRGVDSGMFVCDLYKHTRSAVPRIGFVLQRLFSCVVLVRSDIKRWVVLNSDRINLMTLATVLDTVNVASWIIIKKIFNSATKY